MRNVVQLRLTTNNILLLYINETVVSPSCDRSCVKMEDNKASSLNLNQKTNLVIE